MAKSLKVVGVASVPRFGPTVHAMVMSQALARMGIHPTYSTSAFWSHGMSNLLDHAIAIGADYVLTIDYDSLFGEFHVKHLLNRIASNPDVDAIAPLQVKRYSDQPLGLGVKDAQPDERGLIECDSAHFGLTVISLSALERTPRPWFHSRPSLSGSWNGGNGQVDDDVWFWNMFRETGNKAFIDTHCNIGHLEERVATFDKNGKPQYLSTDEYWNMILEADSKPKTEYQMTGTKQKFNFKDLKAG